MALKIDSKRFLFSLRWLLDRLRQDDPSTYDLKMELRHIREVIEINPKNYQVRWLIFYH